MTSSAFHKVLGPLVGAAIAVAGAPASDGPAPDAEQRSQTAVAGDIVRTAISAAEQNAALEYWTPKRMAAAQPLGRLLDGAPPERPPSQEGATDSQAAATTSGGERWTRGGKVTRTTGKVYLTLDGRDFTCSASVVDADNKETLITAGHCLKDGAGSWVENWTFVPGYDSGESPYGRYTAREMLVPPRWGRDSDDSYDFGMVVLKPSDGKHVQERTGAQEIAFGAKRGGHTHAFGYPATGGYSGRHLRYCSGRTTADNGGTTAHGMPCEMTEGSSGGPWLSNLDPETGTGTITSVVSFKYADDPHTQYGPTLGKEARRLYDHAQAL